MQVLPTPPPVDRGRAFAEAGVATASWLPVARSRAIRRGRVVGVEAPGGRVALWRDGVGEVHGLGARCPHLGADLGQGRVEGDALVCPFHGWAFGGDGTCLGAPGWDEPPARRARSVSVQERWGLVWLATGPDPVALPELPPGRWRIVRPPAQTIRAHPHLVIGNGLDVAHFDTLHGLDPLAEPVLTVEPPRVSVEIRGRARSRALRRLLGGDVAVRFTTHGGHVATADVFSPVRFRALFTATPVAEGSRTQVVLFLPRGPRSTVRAAVGLYALLHDDARVLEGLRFRRAFTPADGPLAAFAEVVDGLPRGRA
ncbi:Rieske 2Fe-2S domain-containing protein [Rubrivirga sp.]|uniref:Rieske 2Fe-2S domain-containing protein n=1 Tax=Rubrivirga sp. TaxID=1885344 RepID=UPI003B51E147